MQRVTSMRLDGCAGFATKHARLQHTLVAPANGLKHPEHDKMSIALESMTSNCSFLNARRYSADGTNAFRKGHFSQGKRIMHHFNWLNSVKAKLLNQGASRRRKSQPTKVSDAMSLESRVLLSATAMFDASSHKLTVSSTASESIEIGSDASGRVTFNNALVSNGSVKLKTADVESIIVNGGSGANRINLSKVTTTKFKAVKTVSINGNGGNDIITGSEFADRIRGNAGNDTVRGGLGKDSILGDDGIDHLYGEAGDDNLDGGYGNDDIDGSGDRGGDHDENRTGDNDGHDDDHNDGRELKARLNSSSFKGKAEFETKSSGRREFEVELENIRGISGQISIFVNGTLVGKASVVGSKLTFKLYDAQAPVAASGDTIQLQTATGGILASGVLA